MPSQSVQQSHLCLVFSTVTARLCSCHAHLAASSSWGICSTVGFLFSKGIVLVSHRFFLLQRQRKKKAFMTGPLNTKAGACFRQVKKKKTRRSLRWQVLVGVEGFMQSGGKSKAHRVLLLLTLTQRWKVTYHLLESQVKFYSPQNISEASEQNSVASFP